jgi:hypothetical protein
MAANLTSVVMEFLTPEVIAKIASYLGLDKATTLRAAEGSVPALLAGLSDLVATPSGSNQLSKLLSQQQAGSPTDLLNSTGAQSFAETGSNMLSGLFGNRTMDTMAQAIGKATGMGDSSGKSLLGVLGPIVLGALGQQQRKAGLDANGLAALLRAQKDQITAAIPPGLADQLGAAGLIDKAEARVGSGMAAASAAGSRLASASERITSGASQAANAAASRGQWPYWLAALVVLGGLGWYVLQRPAEQTVAETTAMTKTATGTVGLAPADLTVDGVNLSSKLNSSIGTLKAALPGITDDASAQAAMPKINDAIAQLDDITARAAKLSPEARSALAKLVVAVTPAINQMCDKVLATPGAGTFAKPAIEKLRTELDALAKV